MRPLFDKTIKLHLELIKDWSLISLCSISTIIDLSHLVEIKFASHYFRECNVYILMDMATFIQRAHNLSSLSFYHYLPSDDFPLSTETICSLIPRQVKHLQVPMTHLNEIKKLLEKCNHLSSIQLNITHSRFSDKIIQWLTENTINSTYRRGHKILSIWLGRKVYQSNEFCLNHKRIKVNWSSSDESIRNFSFWTNWLFTFLICSVFTFRIVENFIILET